MKYGLFIGINQYTNGITPLKCARNDALALSKLFALNGYDVNVLLDHEATASNIRKTLRSMGKQLKNDDVFFFYFSGHGCEVNKNHYLIGQAAYPDGIDEGEETVALNRVRELTDIPGVRRLFVLDCCRNDLHGGKGLEVCPESRDIALAKISNFQYDTAEIIHPLIVTSCSTGERSYEDVEKGRGYFTQIFEHTLENKSVNTFAVFRKAIAEGMEKIQKVMKWKQTLCWHGNVDSWDEFKLFDSWNGNMQNSVVSNSLQTNSVFSEPPLSPEERMKFNDLIFSIEEFCNSMHDSPLPDSMKKSLISIQESGKLLLKQELNRKNFNQIQELHAEAESLKKSFQFYKACKKNAEELNAGKDFLKQHGITLDPEIAILEKKALFAQNRNDFEVANNIYLSAEKIISKPKEELSLNLKNIADLKAEIKQTEEQLSCSSESIHANFDSIEQLQKAESLKDYAKMISVLSAILKNDQKALRLQSATLDSITILKRKIHSVKKNLPHPSELAEQLCKDAEKYYDLKNYTESENYWKSALNILENANKGYKSYQKAAAELEILENEHFSKMSAVPENIASLKNKAIELVSQKNYFNAELCIKEGIESLKKNLDAVDLLKSQIKEMEQLKLCLTQNGVRITTQLKHIKQAVKSGNYEEAQSQLSIINLTISAEYDSLVSQKKEEMLTLKDKCIRMGRWLHWKEFNCERDIYEDFQFKESAFLDEECKSEKIRLMNKEILILKLRKLQFFLGGVIEWSFFLIHTFVLCLIYFGVSPYFLLLVSPFIICPLQKTISSTIGSVMFLFTGSYLFVCPMLLGVISALSNQNLSQTSVGTGMFISNVILLCVWLYFLVKTDDKITKKIWKARYKEIEQA